MLVGGFSMADLNALYKDYGIRGIVPYAGQRNSAGYLYLLGRLKAGDSFYAVFSTDTSVPFLSVRGRDVIACAYSGRDVAQAAAEKLGRDGYHVEPTVCSGEAFLEMLSGLGVDGLLFDDTSYVYLSDLVASVPDGFVNVDTPLRNSLLNAALYLAYQEFAAGRPWDDLFVAFFRVLKSSHVLVPVLLNGDGDGGVRLEESCAPLLQKGDGEKFICVFTDMQRFTDFWDSSESMREIFPRKLTYVADYEELLGIMKANGGCSAAFNPGTANLFLSPQLIEAAERSLVMGAADLSDAGPDDDGDDPIPDFLR